MGIAAEAVDDAVNVFGKTVAHWRRYADTHKLMNSAWESHNSCEHWWNDVVTRC